MNYTKGEWKVKVSKVTTGEFYSVESTYGKQIMKVTEISPTKEAKANAHLIASAPRMARLLEYLVDNGWNSGVGEEAKEILDIIKQKA